MKKSVCLYFQVHQPTRLRQYRFFDIGKDSHYYDDFANRTALRKIAEKCYLPMNDLILNAIKESKGKVKVAFSISGSALDQFERYNPEVIESFRALADTGCVEFLCETYNHSLASLGSQGGFEYQVNKHKNRIESLFGQTPKIFRNTELIYSDSIAEEVYKLGFKTMVTEGAKHILGWKSPNYVYSAASQPKMKLLLRNYSLSDDISFRFSDRGWNNWPLTAEKYISWLEEAEGEMTNLFMDYESFGEYNDAGSGIFDFMRAVFRQVAGSQNLEFLTPSQNARKHQPVAELEVPEPVSWSDEERDVTTWLGNELQVDAFNKIYSLTESLSIIDDDALWGDFNRLQESDNFFYMNTRFFTSSGSRRTNPYESPYDAFINYMNILSDFIIRVENALAEKN